MITITSKVDGYRRCGVEHPAHPIQYPDDRFTPEVLAILQSTPVLKVEIQESQQQEDQNETQQETQGESMTTLAPDQFETYTVAELKDMATKMGLNFTTKTTKKELIDLICQEPVIPGPAE